MEVSTILKLNSFPLPPPPNRRNGSRCAISSPVFRLHADDKLHRGFSAQRQSTLRCSGSFASFAKCIERKVPCAFRTSFQVLEFERTCYGYRLQKLNTSRYVVGRCVLVGAGSPFENPASEAQLEPKVRAACFYLVTALSANFLFLLMLVAHPFVLVFDRYQRKAHHCIAKIWAMLTVSPFYKVEFEGLENLPKHDSPAIYVSNHQSFLDIYTLLTLGWNFKFISKTSIFLIPIIGWAMFLMNTIPLKRTDTRSQLETFKLCIALVKKGISIFIFPEGTRSRDGKLGAFKKGAFSIAAKTGVPVVPISLIGTGKIMPKGMENVVNRGTVKVIVHKPIQGTNADELCIEARNIIADTLNLEGGYVADLTQPPKCQDSVGSKITNTIH